MTNAAQSGRELSADLVYVLERELTHFMSLEIADRVRELHVQMIFHAFAAELEDARIRESLRNDSVSHYE
jgi:hypothetical protein